MPLEPGPAQNPRARLLAAGKALFARLGYEHTSTSAIAREAGTSESQLVRHFGGKAGLLEAIYNEAWTSLNEVIQRLAAAAPDSRVAVTGVLSAFLGTFRRDPALARVFLFEGRRRRGERHEITLSSGFREFAGMFRRLIQRGQQDGTFPKDVDHAALASAMMGAAEGMMRDWLLAKLAGEPVPFSERAIPEFFTTLVDRLSAGVSDSALRG